MSYGSMRQMRSYARKVFDRDARLAQMTDGRVDPTTPLGAVLSTWQWGLVRRAPRPQPASIRILGSRLDAIYGTMVHW
jgi:thiamine biosynthesis lipoprotein ApbE